MMRKGYSRSLEGYVCRHRVMAESGEIELVIAVNWPAKRANDLTQPHHQPRRPAASPSRATFAHANLATASTRLPNHNVLVA